MDWPDQLRDNTPSLLVSVQPGSNGNLHRITLVVHDLKEGDPVPEDLSHLFSDYFQATDLLNL